MEERNAEIVERARLLPQILLNTKLYEEKLAGTSLLIVFQDGKATEYIEPHFWRSNFMHLVGANSDILTASSFYEHCLNNKLTIEYFTLTKYAAQKLDILPSLIDLTKKAKMLGDFNGQSKDLYTEKLAGGIYGCMGFVKNENGVYIPNTAIAKSVKDLTVSPYSKILAIYQKPFSFPLYPHIPAYICKDLKSKINSLKWPEEVRLKIEAKE